MEALAGQLPAGQDEPALVGAVAARTTHSLAKVAVLYLCMRASE